MSLFDAFYVMTYTATTIGFGEIPYPFSYAQRLWMTFSIYLTVIGWTYMLGSIFGLTRQPAFRAAIARHRFEARVRSWSTRSSSSAATGERPSAGRRARRDRYATVVVESDPERAQPHLVLDTRQPSSLLVADARAPDVLEAAGLRKRTVPDWWRSPAATRSTRRSSSARGAGAAAAAAGAGEVAGARETLETIGDVIIVNPYETLAFNLQVALAQADVLRLEDWLSGVPGEKPPAAHRGAARPLGDRRPRALRPRGRRGVRLRRPQLQGDRHRPGEVRQRRHPRTALAEDVLRRAGIEQACGLVAGTDVDANNLAIVNNARRLRRKLFVVIRQTVPATAA